MFNTGLIAVSALLIGAVIGFIVKKLVAQATAKNAESRAEQLISDAKNKQRELLLQAKDKALKIIDDAKAEETQRRQLAEGARRPKVGHAGRRLECAAGRHDLAPDRRHAVSRQRPGIGRFQAIDHLRFALGPKDR